MILTVEELLEVLGPNLRDPDSIQSCLNYTVWKDTKIKEIKDGSTLTLLFGLRGEGTGGMPAKGGQNQPAVPQNQLLTHMTRYTVGLANSRRKNQKNRTGERERQWTLGRREGNGRHSR